MYVVVVAWGVPSNRIESNRRASDVSVPIFASDILLQWASMCTTRSGVLYRDMRPPLHS